MPSLVQSPVVKYLNGRMRHSKCVGPFNALSDLIWRFALPCSQALHQGGRVIYLHASVEQQVGRTARDRNRPLLRTANPEATLRALLEARDPLYREIADVVVETDERPPRMVVIDILERLQQLPPR